jgi:hypothetical protein
LLALNTDFPIKANAFLDCQFLNQVFNANNFVLYVINTGYLIPFFKDPTSAFKKKNNKSTLTYTSFAQTAI